MAKNQPRILRPKQLLPSPSPQQMFVLLPQNLSANGNLVLFPNGATAAPTLPAPLPRKPYFRCVKGYTSDKKDVGNICRTCYRAVFNEHYIKLYDDENKESSEKLRQMLTQVVPAIDLEVYLDAVMCVKCVKMLFDSYDFTTKCLETEQKFNTWVAQRKGVLNNDVNLLILVEESTDKDNVEQIQIEKSDSQGSDVVNSVVLDHDYATVKDQSVARGMKKKFSYRVKLSGEEAAKRVKLKRETVRGPFLCECCGQLFKTYQAFVVHMSAHDSGVKESLHECPHCTYSAVSALLLKRHMWKHAPPTHKCGDCTRSFRTSKALQSHVKHVHLGLADPVQCHVCGKSFKYYTSLNMHLISHNPEPHLKFTCEICDKKFALKRQYVNHLISHDTTRFACDLCGKKLKRKENLQKHREIFHENKSKYQCDVCRKCYWKEEDLARHKIRIHETGNDYRCSICDTYFPTQAKYNRHLSGVHREKTYECDICGKKLKYARSFKIHYEIFHGNRGKFKCEICDKGYWKQEDLLKHEFKVHRIETPDDDLDLFGGEGAEGFVEFDMDKENVSVDDFESLF
ncbi:hypothetical protein MTP99_005669 [Tenebrio molitor]|jgi:hypothetical protein|uniref:Uncharacterized protein n=2 Tax=Tenebrio molitor TaxID=7067 RepID=A0A8J6HSW5_TENMO|nr:hypothetical protein GEV33_003163 [Tenebrio molitor]KAJ3618866.1 hypothetical protein MTP99_005669 [Tenebrio molitor]